MDDFSLLERWRAGDVDAGNELFERHFDSIQRFFSNKVPLDPLDLVQRTFLACVESRDRFRNQSSFRTFLFAIAHHELMAYWRREARKSWDPSAQSVLDLHPSPSSLFVEAIEERTLLEALRSIPFELQVVVELYYWEGLSAPQVSEALEIPEGTVRSRLRRGLEHLKKKLQEFEHDPSELPPTLTSLQGWARSIGRALTDLPGC